MFFFSLIFSYGIYKIIKLNNTLIKTKRFKNFIIKIPKFCVETQINKLKRSK